MRKPVTIVGGGLAGLALGILLRRGQTPVRLLEAGSYPRHKVCGEYLSGRGAEVLEQLEVLDDLRAGGARTSREVHFFGARATSSPVLLARPALCCSRRLLDETLANEFLRLGGELQTGTRARADTFQQEGVVRATGRRPAPRVNGWRWFGLKAHARGVRLGAGLEMHFQRRGYAGLCRIENDLVNVCGLFRARAGDAPSPLWLRGERGTELSVRLAGAEWIGESACSVAGLMVEPAPVAPDDPPSVGDSFSMIPPLTGNGMSLALESAVLAAAPLRGYAGGRLSWPDCRAAILERHRARFTRRLRYAGWLQRVALNPVAAAVFPRLAGRFPGLVNAAFGRTR